MRSAGGTRALLVTCAAALLAAALARRSCNTAHYGILRGREVHIQDQRMSPRTPDWKIRVPPVCERIVGVSATACDADGAPSVFLSSLTHGLVMRDGELSTGAYLYVTVYCDPDEVNPEVLELLTTRTPPSLKFPSSRIHRPPNRPWKQTPQPVAPISPDRLIVLNPTRWPKTSAASWPDQPTVLGVKSFTYPGSPALKQSLYRPQSMNANGYPTENFQQRPAAEGVLAGHLPLRRPEHGLTLLMSRSPTTEFPGARWDSPRGDDHEHDDEQDLGHEHDNELEPGSEHGDEHVEEHAGEPADHVDGPDDGEGQVHDEGQVQDEAQDHVEGQDQGMAPDQVEGQDQGEGQDHGEGQNQGEGQDHVEGHEPDTEQIQAHANNDTDQDHEHNDEEESANGAKPRSRWPIRPLTLARHLAQWWTSHVHSARHGRRMPRRRRLLLRNARRRPIYFLRL